MNISKIATVENLCMEVAELANEVIKDRARCNKINEEKKMKAVEGQYINWEYPSNKKTAALKRRSLDLTRALAEMRKG